MTDSHLDSQRAPALPSPAVAAVLSRVPALDTCEPAEALAIYEDISTALAAALDGSDDAVRAVGHAGSPDAAPPSTTDGDAAAIVGTSEPPAGAV